MSLRVAVDAALEQKDSEAVTALVSDLPSTPVETRKVCLRSLKDAVADDPRVVWPALPGCKALLEDEDRAVRLTTAKLFVAAAETDPNAVVTMVPTFADRLADDEEFYFVRARSAEALGYVALDHPDTVASPEVLADLRVGLSFDEPEVKEKLAKALEFVAEGNPGRLRHHVTNLAEHLDDENDLVRYHLCTALAVLGCENPDSLAAASEALVARLSDESIHVRGRATEALGILARSTSDDPLIPVAKLTSLDGETEPFVAERAEFAVSVLEGNEQAPEPSDTIGTIGGIRETTDEAVAEITAPDGECPQCGLALPENGPPMCPDCGMPYWTG